MLEKRGLPPLKQSSLSLMFHVKQKTNNILTKILRIIKKKYKKKPFFYGIIVYREREIILSEYNEKRSFIMTKMTKMGIICNMVAEMCHNLAQAQRDTKTFEEMRLHEYYHRARGLGYCLISMGIHYELMTSYRNGRSYVIGVAISDMTKGSPAFADMAYCVLSLGCPVEYSVLYDDFIEQCEVNDYNSDSIKLEIRKIYGCK